MDHRRVWVTLECGKYGWYTDDLNIFLDNEECEDTAKGCNDQRKTESMVVET